MRILSTAVITALAIITIAACSTSPTGRSQVKLFSSDRLNSMGSQTFASLKTEQKVSNQRVENQYVQCIADALIPFIPAGTFDGTWEVVVFDDEQINAFALPGGKIGVYTGLLKVATNQHQLATVIGHEITHVTANHSNERLSTSQLASIGLIVTEVALKDNQYKDLTMAGLGLGVQYGVIMPYGRAQESESDIIGLNLMAEAGFDPNESVALWQNMAKASNGQQPPELLSTHPSHSTRINDLRVAIQGLSVNPIEKPNCTL